MTGPPYFHSVCYTRTYLAQQRCMKKATVPSRAIWHGYSRDDAAAVDSQKQRLSRNGNITAKVNKVLKYLSN